MLCGFSGNLELLLYARSEPARVPAESGVRPGRPSLPSQLHELVLVAWIRTEDAL
jgi:hypothetical protein